jgi:CO/xanthine dehydrogenase FAD-binding subunit
MIPFDFDYYLPDSVKEASDLYNELYAREMQPLYYSGGSEIISMARAGNIFTRAVIDLKNIPECNTFGIYEDNLVIGSCITLSNITEHNIFPLLSKTAGRIADHTNQCRITIGGNLSGTIIYRETALPLMLCDSTAVVAKSGELEEIPFGSIFNKKMLLKPGEFVVQLKVGTDYLQLPYIHVKKTKNEKIDYPLISVAAIRKDNRIRAAFSGVCPYPFRSSRMEDDLNGSGLTDIEKVDHALTHLPEHPMDDVYGSDRFRKFVLKNTLIDVLKT